MLRFIRSLFAWKCVFIESGWRYSENAITGRRAARYIGNGGYRPVNFHWLEGGRGLPIINGETFTGRHR